jgi:C4-dicarboxylate-specific signal transduction histidine kinase/cation transport regulator ChaB
LKFLRSQPILRQVIYVSAALMVLFGATVAWSAFRTRAERADEVREEAVSLAVAAAAVFNEYFTSLDATAAILQQHPAVRALNGDMCRALFVSMLHEQPLLNDVLLRAADGRLVATAVEAKVSQPPAPAFIFEVVKAGHPAVSQLVRGPITGRQTVLLAFPVRGDSGAITGVLGFSLNLPRLGRLFAGLTLPPSSTVTLVDRNGLVMARNLEPEKFIGSAFEAPEQNPADVPRMFLRGGPDGVERFHGNAVIDRGPWLLSVGIPRSEVLARLAPLWRRNLIILTLATFCVIALAMWISAEMAVDLKRLRRAAHRIAEGDLSPPEQAAVHSRESGQLQDSFVTMAGRLRDARDTHEHQLEQERKMREALQSLQRQVVRQERLAAVGLLVSGVAHELNNPLQAVLGTIELLERRGNLDPELREEITFVKTQSGRAREIIRNLSRFSSQNAGPPTLVDLREVINEVVQLRKRDLESSSIALDIETSSVRTIYASFTELEQVTLNFVINAQQAIDGAGRVGGRVLIRLRDIDKKVRLEVSDNGPGVLPADEARLFQPFFTTKPVGKGTGLGLSVSYGIIDSYGGVIGHLNNDKGGATFFFELPAAEPGEGEASATNDRPPVLRGRVLPNL